MTWPNRYNTVLFHVSSWGILLICIYLWAPRPHDIPETSQLSWIRMLGTIPMIGLFYVHAYWLMPAYFLRKKWWKYLVGVIIAASLASLALTLIGRSLWPSGGVVRASREVTRSRMAAWQIFPCLIFLMASASVGSIRENNRQEKLRKERETDHLRTELSFLRSQVNPHFMLNVLNSMALLARRKSDHLEPAIMELAGLMSYMLHAGIDETIPIEDEINYLRAYIDLQMLRFKDDVLVRFDTANGPKNRYIEPMLLIPLVENAFKHGIGLLKEPVIHIDIDIDAQERLSMTVRNKFNPGLSSPSVRPAGIGLKNLEKRLELIYPGQYELKKTITQTITEDVTENWYIIAINIPLQ
jgi:two-component system LytT family sensor kinase